MDFTLEVLLKGPNSNLMLPKNVIAEDFDEFNLNERHIVALLKWIM